MSRRGRGGGRGRGGRFGGSQKIGGVELSWDPDLDLDKTQPTPTFPVSQSTLSPVHIATSIAMNRQPMRALADYLEGLQTNSTATSDFPREEASRTLPYPS